MKTTLFYQLTIRDRKGKIKKKTDWIPCKSFLQQYLQMVYAHFKYSTVDVQDTTNTTRSVNGQQAAWMRGDGGAGNTDKGILVGTGSTAPTNTDYVMETPIAHGTGSGELQYLTTEYITDPAVSGANVDGVVQRGFTNGSGASITVNEIGFQVQGATYEFLLIRDVISGGQAVADAETLTVAYTLRTTV